MRVRFGLVQLRRYIGRSTCKVPIKRGKMRTRRLHTCMQRRYGLTTKLCSPGAWRLHSRLNALRRRDQADVQFTRTIDSLRTLRTLHVALPRHGSQGYLLYESKSHDPCNKTACLHNCIMIRQSMKLQERHLFAFPLLPMKWSVLARPWDLCQLNHPVPCQRHLVYHICRLHLAPTMAVRACSAELAAHTARRMYRGWTSARNWRS